MGKFKLSLIYLKNWFLSNQRVLPWRHLPSPYRVWVSEIMLQQTQVITVIPYFERFMKNLPTVEKLASASEHEVMQLWAGLGYYSRARNLQKGARMIVEQGTFPKDKNEWLNIPGVGPYTAGAICSIANNQVEPILDGNVERVLSRLRRVNRTQGESYFKQRLWRLSKIFVKRGFQNQVDPQILNQALMELGAMICTPKKPKCLHCPVQSICRAYQRGDQESYPPKKKPKQWKQVDEQVICVYRKVGDQIEILLRKREKGEWRQGLWDLIDDSKFIFSNPISKDQLQFKGEIQSKHIVTQHKIKRVTEVYQWGRPKRISAAENSEAVLKWTSIEDPEVPIGSALKKTLHQIKQLF